MKDKDVIDLGKEMRKEERRQKLENLKKKALDWWDENKVAVQSSHRRLALY